MREEDPIVEDSASYNEFVAVARERSAETVELWKIFRAGRDFEKGDLVHWRQPCAVVRYLLWRSYQDWRRLDSKLNLGWDIEVISNPEDVILNSSYFKKASRLQFEPWLLAEEISMQARFDSARSLLSEAPIAGMMRAERRFLNKVAWIYEKELEMIQRASTGTWKK